MSQNGGTGRLPLVRPPSRAPIPRYRGGWSGQNHKKKIKKIFGFCDNRLCRDLHTFPTDKDGTLLASWVGLKTWQWVQNEGNAVLNTLVREPDRGGSQGLIGRGTDFSIFSFVSFCFFFSLIVHPRGGRSCQAKVQLAPSMCWLLIQTKR